MSNTPRIEERENGPLLARGIPRLTDQENGALETKAVMALCRCGQSANKPFCDGSHNEAGFQSSGGTPAGRDRQIEYPGAEVTVLFNPRLCSHAAECAARAPASFNSAKRPWIMPDNSPRQDVEAVIAACPSGALSLKDGGHQTAEEAGITVERHGPYRVTNVALDADPNAIGATADKYVLCRCGLSGNKPYCDGSHQDKGWRDDQS